MARRSGRRTDYTWSGNNAVATVITSTIVIFELFQFLNAVTIMRIRGEIMLFNDLTPNAGDNHRIGVGLIVAQSSLLASGFASTPLADPNAPWMWWYATSLQARNTSYDPAWGVFNRLVPIDTKAMPNII